MKRPSSVDEFGRYLATGKLPTTKAQGAVAAIPAGVPPEIVPEEHKKPRCPLYGGKECPAEIPKATHPERKQYAKRCFRVNEVVCPVLEEEEAKEPERAVQEIPGDKRTEG